MSAWVVRKAPLAVGVAVLAIGLGASAALASSRPKDPTTLSLSVAARPHHPPELTLTARLQGRLRTAGRPVAFFVVPTEFRHARAVRIGTAETVANGTATMTYKPTWSGKERFVAKLSVRGAHVRAASASYRVTASAPGPLYATANPSRPFVGVGGVFLDVILTVVALVWLSLVVVLAVAFGWMPRLARGGIR